MKLSRSQIFICGLMLTILSILAAMNVLSPNPEDLSHPPGGKRSVPAGPPPGTQSMPSAPQAPPASSLQTDKSLARAGGPRAVTSSYRSLIARYPAGLVLEAQTILGSGDSGKAMALAEDIGFCLGLERNRAELERLGAMQKLDPSEPASDPAERSRIEAFCQTAGKQGLALQHQLFLLAAKQGNQRAMVRVFQEQLDPSSSNSYQLGQLALGGSSPLVLNTVVLERRPEAFGLSAADWNVLRRALSMAASTPALEDEGFDAVLFTSQQAESLARAGISSPKAYELWQAGQIPRVSYAEIPLSSAEEQRALKIVQALIQGRRLQH